jgi:hypothetical protein
LNLTKAQIAVLQSHKPLPKRKRPAYEREILMTDPAVRDWIRVQRNRQSAFWAHKVVPGLNERGHWATREHRRKDEKDWGDSIAAGKSADQARLVRFTRYGPRLLDDDNLPQCFKAIRDGIAKRFGVSDGPKGFIHWEYRQEQTAKGCFGVRVKFLGVTR